MAVNGHAETIHALQRKRDGLAMLRGVDHDDHGLDDAIAEADAELERLKTAERSQIPKAKSLVTMRVFREAMRIAGHGISDHIAKMFGVRDARISSIETRLAILEQKQAGCHDRGVWKASHWYEPQNMVSHDGGLWIAQRANRDVRPDAHSGEWRLAVKSHR